MPEPRAKPRSLGVTPPLWPDWLPDPQGDSITVTGPLRAQLYDVLTGPTRARVIARTAPMEVSFACWLTAEQMEGFEAWYRDVVETHDGEFYARWIGGSRIVAFSGEYSYGPLGRGYILAGRLIRTRVDETACDAFIVAHFGAIYRADLDAADIYEADLAATDVYADTFDLRLIAAHEC